MFAIRRVAATQRSTVTRVLARSFADEASNITLNFAMPHGTLYENEDVELVRLTSCAGEYGVTAGHTPNVSQLSPGLAQVYKNKDAEPDVYFVSGGFAFMHPNSVLDVAAVEAVKLSDLDPKAVEAQLGEARARAASAAPESVEAAEAQIEVEVNQAMATALGLSA